jgi:uncharacterized membrane protein
LIPQKQFLSIQFLLLEFAAYKFFFVISFCYCSKYISIIKTKKKNREQRKKKQKNNRSKRRLLVSAIVEKLNKKILEQINSELAQI